MKRRKAERCERRWFPCLGAWPWPWEWLAPAPRPQWRANSRPEPLGLHHDDRVLGPFPQSFNPFITSTYSGYVNHLIYEPLYMINYAKLQPEPWLATAYNWSNGGKTITFKIRPGVMWSNGTPSARPTWPSHST